jgi:DMSO/TMAO reductase YedYZ molybdopterin-dependent catalytic subunit
VPLDESQPGSAPTAADLPPGQHQLDRTWPSATSPEAGIPCVSTESWELTLTTEREAVHRWDWAQLRALPSEEVSVDLHCVEGWSVLGSTWGATSVHQLFAGVETSAPFATVTSYDTTTTNLPLEDLLEMPTWIAFSCAGRDLPPGLGGPARLLVPHLYLFKSLKWVHRITLTDEDRPGSRESAGCHHYGDPWRQQRRRGD